MSRELQSQHITRHHTKVNSTKEIKFGFFTILTLVALSVNVKADSRLSFTKSSNSSIEVRLQNEESVAGIQFSIHSSGNIILDAINIAPRASENAWTVQSNKVNDSTMYVILLRTTAGCLPAGSGSIAELTIHITENSKNPYRLSFDNVVTATQGARMLAVASDPLEWSVELPTFALDQNYPNPFNPSTTIPYVLQEPSYVSLTVYDITGREIKKVSEGMVSAGQHAATWNSSDQSGSIVSSGIYFVRLQVGSKFEVKKMILAR